jgi:DNA-binding NtrC family response regulator
VSFTVRRGEAMALSASACPIARTIIGESLAIRQLRELIALAAPSRLAVLVQGPTGAGKELVAAALHAASGRSGPLVPFNVCAIGESVFEDALFGHVRGAYTGAVSDTPGLLREAHGGTVFLDEISGLQLALQAKLLRAVETRAFRPVGATHDVRSDFRVVAATNERLDLLVAERRFRADLAHRISGVVIHVPPLVERLEDVPLLVRHFLDRAGFTHTTVTRDAIVRLQAYDWPGNVRELEHTVEWAAVLSAPVLGKEAVEAALAQRTAGVAPAMPSVERRALQQLLERHRWNTESAARELGIHRATLYRRMKRLRLSVPMDIFVRGFGGVERAADTLAGGVPHDLPARADRLAASGLG